MSDSEVETRAASEQAAAEEDAEREAGNGTPVLEPLMISREAKKAAKEAAKREKSEKAAALASFEKEMPKLAAVFKDLGFTPDQRAGWLDYIKRSSLGEAEVVAIIDPKRESKLTKRAWRAWMIVRRHGIKRWLRGQNLVWRLIYAGGWLYLLISSNVKLHWSWLAVLSAVALVVAKVRFVIRDMKPKNMQLVSRGYDERKVQLQRLLETAQRWCKTQPPPNELERYRQDALAVIAEYVRDHRARFGSRQILANLLVRDGDDVVVIARSDGLRPVPQRYKREQCSLVAQAIETGDAKITGDLYADFPHTLHGKKYRSILVLPVWFQGVVVGAVSIDSPEEYHFNIDFDDLQVHLLPYVQLLAAGLSRPA